MFVYDIGLSHIPLRTLFLLVVFFFFQIGLIWELLLSEFLMFLILLYKDLGKGKPLFMIIKDITSDK